MGKKQKENKIISQEQKKATRNNNVTKKPINKKIIIPMAILIIIVLIGTLVVFAFNKNKENESANIAQETKTRNINLVDNEHMHVELDASNDQVPVPNGYVGSKATGENEIDSGYVIYEGTEEVNDSNVADAQKNRNQYVWIPVPDTSKFYGTDSNGKKWGKIYEFSATGSGSNYDQVTGTSPLNWSENNGIMRISSKTSYREPDIVVGSKGYDIDSKLKTLGLGAMTAHEFLKQLEQEFNRMLASVEKYGGFYIGRYETGDLNKDTAVVKKGNTNINNQTWYTMYKKCKQLRGSNTNVETGMTWGNQFDRTLMWLIETGNKTKAEIASNSTSWGNYKNATFDYVNSSGSTVTKNSGDHIMIPTGSSDYTKANNIYDLAGNLRNWTMEAGYSDCRGFRGTYCDDFFGASGSSHGSSNPTYDIISYGYWYGCHAALYVK